MVEKSQLFSINDLGLASLPKVVAPRQDYSIYRKGVGNTYAWGSMGVYKIPKNLDLCSFYVEDHRFKPLLKNSKKALKVLHSLNFKYIIQPDYSVYYDLPLIDQIYRVYVGKRIAHVWAENGFKVIPNLTLGCKELLPFSTFGIEVGSSFAVQIQANDNSKEQDLVDEYTIKSAISIIKPNTVLVYGTTKRIKDLKLDNEPSIIQIKTNIDYLRTL